MSKEMTPKEALQMIQDNITPRTLGILTVEFNVVKKALDRLEVLEKENQELKEKAKKYDEIVNLKTTPNVIEKSLADYMNKCITLEKENQELKEDLRLTTIERTNCENTSEELVLSIVANLKSPFNS